MKTYIHLRLENAKLYQDAKIRAAKEGVTVIKLVEMAIRDYLRKPLSETR